MAAISSLALSSLRLSRKPPACTASGVALPAHGDGAAAALPGPPVAADAAVLWSSWCFQGVGCSTRRPIAADTAAAAAARSAGRLGVPAPKLSGCGLLVVAARGASSKDPGAMVCCTWISNRRTAAIEPLLCRYERLRCCRYTRSCFGSAIDCPPFPLSQHTEPHCVFRRTTPETGVASICGPWQAWLCGRFGRRSAGHSLCRSRRNLWRQRRLRLAAWPGGCSRL